MLNVRSVRYETETAFLAPKNATILSVFKEKIKSWISQNCSCIEYAKLIFKTLFFYEKSKNSEAFIR